MIFNLRDAGAKILEGTEDWRSRLERDVASVRFRVPTDLPPLMEVLPPGIQHLGFAVNSTQAINIARSQLEMWRQVHGHTLPVVTLVVTSDVPLEDEFIHCTSRLRLFRYSDSDIDFAFVRSLSMCLLLSHTDSDDTNGPSEFISSIDG